jgi:hypothetical protein
MQPMQAEPSDDLGITRLDSTAIVGNRGDRPHRFERLEAVVALAESG